MVSRAILQAAGRLTFPRDLGKWDGAYKPRDLHAPLGVWPGDAVTLPDAWGISIAMDVIKGVPFDTAHALFIPTEHGWEVPAFLRWGGWNACPPPEYHVAALRRWHEAFGAELVAISGDRMDLRVERPQPGMMKPSRWPGTSIDIARTSWIRAPRQSLRWPQRWCRAIGGICGGIETNAGAGPIQPWRCGVGDKHAC